MNSKYKVILIHSSIWLVIIAFPLLFNVRELSNINQNRNSFIFGPFFVVNSMMIGIFYLNYLLFIPKFLFKKRYVEYVVICVLLFLAITGLPRLGMMFHIRKPPMPMPMPEMQKGRHLLTILYTNSFLMYVAVFAASIALRLNNRIKSLEKEKIAAQLAYLKSQVNPHFLFNTLNSIYSVSLKEAPQAADMVSRLSEMMRYNMREAQLEKVSLKKELENLTNYIELQKVRLDEKVALKYTIGGTVKEQQIAPLLLLPFIENAFKHGVSSEEESIILIEIVVDLSSIRLLVKNTKVEVNYPKDDAGLGVENTKNRLEFIYPKHHQLSINDDVASYSVFLEITLE